MERSCPDWHLRPGSLPLDPSPATTRAMVPPGAPVSLAAPTNADASVLSTARTLADVLAAGGHTLLSLDLERTVLWKSRQSPDATVAAWHATHGLLSMLSRARCESTLRHNLTTFARCVDVLGYRARAFSLSMLSAPHIQISWRPQLPQGGPPDSFSPNDEFHPVESAANTADPNAPAIVVIHREERSIAFSKPRSDSATDTITYMLPRNAQSWAATQPTEHHLLPPTPSHIQPPVQHVSQQQMQQSPLTQVYTRALQVQPSMPTAAMSSQDGLGASLLSTDDRARAPFHNPRSLPPLTGHAATLPSVHELEGRQSRDPHLRAMPALSMHSAPARPEPLVSAQTASLGRALALGSTMDARAPQPPPAQDYLFGSAPLPHDHAPWQIGASTITTATAPPKEELSIANALVSSTQNYSRRARGGAAAEQRQCANCSTRQTRQWVRGERSCWLCHSCGQFWRKNGYGRPAGLWNRPTFKRSRRKRSSSAPTVGLPARSHTGAGAAHDAANLISTPSAAIPSATVALTGVQPLFPHLGGVSERGSQQQ